MWLRSGLSWHRLQVVGGSFEHVRILAVNSHDWNNCGEVAGRPDCVAFVVQGSLSISKWIESQISLNDCATFPDHFTIVPPDCCTAIVESCITVVWLLCKIFWVLIVVSILHAVKRSLVWLQFSKFTKTTYNNPTYLQHVDNKWSWVFFVLWNGA